ncbi:MAG: sigma 54-interacting transcriptional regulator [Kofleriaceae bacterium]
MHDTAPDEPLAALAPGDLILVAGHGDLFTHVIAGNVITIGRDPSCALRINHPAMSRCHAVLTLGPPITIRDLDSTNGVTVARKLVRGGDAVSLEAGETFHIGGFSFNLVRQRARGASTSLHSGRDQLRVDDPSLNGASSFVRDVARSDTSVLIRGESGAGKDVLAETLHALSGRPGAMARINCAALPENLVESELFGHERGAFTGALGKIGLFESVPGGTVFLDEIGDLPLATQAKLLRAIEAREVVRIGATRATPIDVRFVAATHRDLPTEVAQGRFRHDLYFRLDGITLEVPPLRRRRSRIGGLAARFLEDAAAKLGRSTIALAPEVVVALERYDWPGNVRELKAVIERALLLSRGKPVGVRHLAFAARPGDDTGPPAAAADELTTEQRQQRDQLVAVLEQYGGNQTRAAKALGISRTTLVSRIKLYGLVRPRG